MPNIQSILLNRSANCERMCTFVSPFLSSYRILYTNYIQTQTVHKHSMEKSVRYSHIMHTNWMSRIRHTNVNVDWVRCALDYTQMINGIYWIRINILSALFRMRIYKFYRHIRIFLCMLMVRTFPLLLRQHRIVSAYHGRIKKQMCKHQ